MADEKKPKIDLKARLGKTNVGVAVPPGPPGVAGVPVPVPPPPTGMPGGPPSNRPPSIPVPRGVGPSGIPQGLDPNSPIVAAMQQQERAARPHVPQQPQQPQRIEVDETAAIEANKKGRTIGVVIGLIVGVMLAIVAYFAGSSVEQKGARDRAVAFAHDLSKDATTARGQLEKISQKIDEGREQLNKKTFPATLAADLRAINVDFTGRKLQGARFNGFKDTTTQDLMGFIVSVQAVNERRTLIANLLDTVQKPFADQLNAKPQTLQIAVMQKTARGPFAQLATLKDPLTGDPPGEFVTTQGKVKTYGGGELREAAGVPLIPGALDALCPPATAGQFAQLITQLSKLSTDIKGEKENPENPVEPKPGLLKQADLLIEGLNKVQ